MKLLNDWEMSQWAYFECIHGNDIPEIRKLITTSFWAYAYCRDIKSISEIRDRITSHYVRDLHDKYLKTGVTNNSRECKDYF